MKRYTRRAKWADCIQRGKRDAYVYVYVFFILIWRKIALYTNTV